MAETKVYTDRFVGYKFVVNDPTLPESASVATLPGGALKGGGKEITPVYDS